MAKQDTKSTPLNDTLELTFDSALEKVSDVASDILASEPATQIAELTTEWADEATKFIKKNPWAAVLGAAAIGYYLGASRRRSGGDR